MVLTFVSNLLGTLMAILALAPMFIGLIRDARKAGCKGIADTAKSEWFSYMGGCGLTMYFSWTFSFILCHYL